jgi:hypothetical protein
MNKAAGLIAEKLNAFWLASMDAVPLRVFECCFTFAFLVRMGRNLLNWEEWLTTAGFRPSPTEYLALGYPHPLPPLEPWMVPVFAMGIFGAGLGVFCNRQRRLCLWVLLLCAFYAQGVDYLGSFAYNKIFIGTFAVLATGPGIWKGDDGRLKVSGALPRMIQATLLVLYFAAGIAKAFNGDWLKYHDVLWTQAQGFHRTELAAWLLRNLPKSAWAAMQHSALAFELAAPLFFVLNRTRWLAIAYGIIFHLMIALLMKGLIFFTLQMWAFYAVFIKAEEWRCLFVWLKEIFTKLRSGL